jgi:hypothetical protein
MLHLSITAVIITNVLLLIKKTAMSDLGDIFDMFSQDGDDNKKKPNQDAESQNNADQTDQKTLIINKIIRNKALLFTLIGIGFMVIGAAAYFLTGYINDLGAKSIMENVKPFIK